MTTPPPPPLTPRSSTGMPASPPSMPPSASPPSMPPPPSAGARPQFLPGVAPAGAATPPKPGATIEVERVSCTFGSLVAVSDVTFSITPGITALLGPNGAGKSTLLRVMSGLEAPTWGKVRVLGADPRSSAPTRGKIGMVPQQDGVFDRMSAFDFVALSADLQGVEDSETATLRALDLVDLASAADRRVSTFSKGMRQRAKIAQAIVFDPSVVFLDEPLNGLDPKQRRHAIDIFTRLADAGKTVVVSSHVLEEVERFGSRVVVVVDGRLGAEGDYRHIRQLMDDQPLRFAIETSDPARMASALIAGGMVSSVTIESDRRVEVRSADAAALRRAIPAYAHQLGVRLWSFVPLDDDLESVFRYLVEDRR